MLLDVLEPLDRTQLQAIFVAITQKTGRKPNVSVQTAPTSLFQFTETSLLVPRLTAGDHEGIITELAGRLETAGRIEDSTLFVDAVLAHEEQNAGVFDQVAFPVAHSKTVKEFSFAFGLAPRPFHWRTAEAPLVSMVVLMAVPFGDEAGYLSLLTTFCDFFKDKKVVARLKNCVQPEEMAEIFSQANT
jgi:mannitol/fructose-specific phosphotransferase system IIA component (Ntr-type)